MDDTDLIHIDLTKDKSVDKVHDTIQNSINSWGNPLIATGRVLQPRKCFYSIIFFKWINGIWKYANNSLKGEFSITIPLPRGRAAAIDHKSINYVEKILGTMTSLDGNSGASLQMIKEKAQQWNKTVRNRCLHCPKVWFSLKVQLWPQIGYGLCSLMATFNDLEGALHWQYYQIFPFCGVV